MPDLALYVLVIYALGVPAAAFVAGFLGFDDKSVGIALCWPGVVGGCILAAPFALLVLAAIVVGRVGRRLRG